MNRSSKIKNTLAKSEKEPVTGKAHVPPVRHIGRPKGSKNKKTLLAQAGHADGVTVVNSVVPADIPFGKVKKSFDKMMADAVLAQHEVSEPAFDGGGTAESGHVVSKESLERRVARRLNVLDRYLTDERLLSLLALSGLKEVGIYEGIMMDKALVLKGQPTVIVGSADREAMDTVLPRLMQELRRRKLITTVSERKVEFTNPVGE